jgi:hypothetical protein
MQHDRYEQLPRFGIGRRAVVRVVNEQGQPVGDARVTLYACEAFVRAVRAQEVSAADSMPLLDLRTGADGRVVFLTGIDAPESGSEFILSVTAPDSEQPVSQRVSLDQAPWQVTLAQTSPQLPRQLDLALIIDTTGSMGDELDYLKVEIDHIAAEVHARFPKVDQRFGLILYRDQRDEYVTRSFDFTPSVSDFRRTLAAQSANGGGDYPEAMHLALEQSLQLSWRGTGTAKVAFLVADAPPHTQFAQRTLDAVKRLRQQGVTVFPIASSGVRDQAEFVMRAIGFLTQGEYLFLTDHSGVGNSHAQPQTSSYAVERLDQLMIRKIIEKLSGQSKLPRDVIAIEEPIANEQIPPTVTPSSLQHSLTSPVAPAPVYVTIPAPPPSFVSEVFAVLCEINWRGLVRSLLCPVAASLLIVVERVRGI